MRPSVLYQVFAFTGSYYKTSHHNLIWTSCAVIHLCTLHSSLWLTHSISFQILRYQNYKCFILFTRIMGFLKFVHIVTREENIQMKQWCKYLWNGFTRPLPSPWQSTPLWLGQEGVITLQYIKSAHSLHTRNYTEIYSF